MQNSLDMIRERAEIPGVAVAVVSPRGEIAAQSVGVVNNDTKQSVTEATVFEAASLSKPVFAYIVLKMVESGVLDLDESLCEYGDFGPDTEKIRRSEQYPGNYQKLTVSMILSHQAGLPNEFKRDKPETFDYVAPVGEQFAYSGEAYCFLQEVVENIAKPKKLEELAQTVFRQLGMEHSTFLLPTDAASQAVGHFADGQVDSRKHFYGIHPAASLYTTAIDYGKFLHACVTDPFIREHMFAPAMPDLAGRDAAAAMVPHNILSQITWGLGIGLQKNADETLTAFHWGDNKTGRNFAAINLTTNQAVVCLTNSANGPAIFPQVIDPIVGDLSATYQWLYPREGFSTQQAVRRGLSDLKQSASKVPDEATIAPPNPRGK